MFSYVEEHFNSLALDLSWHLAPWDRPVFQADTAAISAIRVHEAAPAAHDFTLFRNWCVERDVRLVSCRLAQNRLGECAFLHRQGFRFIELNYRPTRVGLEVFAVDPEITISPADPADAPEISSFAAQIFEVGRLHVDPEIGPELGNLRYAAWAANAFHHPGQRVLTCRMEGRIVAFMVVEKPTSDTRFWSLVGLAPGLAGKGLGRRVWRAMLAFHHREGVREVSTSISSHNVTVHNLYATLGFRFPAPTITLHWCPSGPAARPGA